MKRCSRATTSPGRGSRRVAEIYKTKNQKEAPESETRVQNLRVQFAR